MTDQAEIKLQQTGIIITSGPADWQIIQCDAQKIGQIALHGRWVSSNQGIAEVQLVYEDTGI